MVRDVQVRGGYVLHVGTVEGTLAVGDTVTLTIDGVCTVTIQILYTVVAVTECVQFIVSASSFVWLQSFSFMEFTKAFSSLALHRNISTTVHAMTKSLVPFCSAQDGESTDMNSLVF